MSFLSCRVRPLSLASSLPVDYWENEVGGAEVGSVSTTDSKGDLIRPPSSLLRRHIVRKLRRARDILFLARLIPEVCRNSCFSELYNPQKSKSTDCATCLSVCILVGLGLTEQK